MNAVESPAGHISVVITIRNGAEVVETVAVRPTNRSLRLGGRDYDFYRIVRPPGFEGEEIIHRPESGTTALLAAVFMALAEAQRKPGGGNLPAD
jgi:hypothetical protein